ncbi:hypothetical protein [Streptomyces sp. NPDC047928]|uniref:hypothetical protein n=1 Tax=unclassified Streptomyces TaxID=2593676 RepID=UPI003723091A
MPEAVEQASLRDAGDRMRLGALLLVRHCGFHQDTKFSPWFEPSRLILGRVVEAAKAVHRDGDAHGADLAGLQAAVQEVLEESDPEGPPFETEIVDHLVFADEVLEFLLAPDEPELLGQALERADELAEAHEEMGREEYEGSDDWEPAPLFSLEAEARTLDVEGDPGSAAALARSEAFARAYAEVIEKCYSDDDAGRAE